jgi:uncharacterized OsmC-like protein
MYSLTITYDDPQHVTARKEPSHNSVAIDCPFTGKGVEFSPASLLGISLASCMLLSMGAIAQRDGISLRGTDVDIGVAGMDKIFPHVDRITLTFRFPQEFDEDERRKLERAAGLCPIMASIDADTEVLTTFEYGVIASA